MRPGAHQWDQNPKFRPLSETTSIPTPFICGVLPPPEFTSLMRTLHYRLYAVTNLSFLKAQKSYKLTACRCSQRYSIKTIGIKNCWGCCELVNNLQSRVQKLPPYLKPDLQGGLCHPRLEVSSRVRTPSKSDVTSLSTNHKYSLVLLNNPRNHCAESLYSFPYNFWVGNL